MTPGEIRRLIAINGYAAWNNCLVGNPAPRVRAEYERSSNPEPGDLVLETSTYYRWVRDPDGDPGPALGYLLRRERTWEEYKDDPDEGYWENYTFVDPLLDPRPEFRWYNCSFIRVHTAHPERESPHVITRPVLVDYLSGLGFDLK